MNTEDISRLAVVAMEHQPEQMEKAIYLMCVENELAFTTNTHTCVPWGIMYASFTSVSMHKSIPLFRASATQRHKDKNKRTPCTHDYERRAKLVSTGFLYAPGDIYAGET